MQPLFEFSRLLPSRFVQPAPLCRIQAQPVFGTRSPMSHAAHGQATAAVVFTFVVVLCRGLRRYDQNTRSRQLGQRCLSNQKTSRAHHIATSALQRRHLGTSSLEVTEVCLGTMTWGVQNSEEEAHDQLDYAIKKRGVNFVDAAEFYPVPSTDPAWCPGTTEEYIGNWLEKYPDMRSKIVIATKVVGFYPKSRVAARRQQPECEPEAWPDGRLDADSIQRACDASLRRLQTDYIDLYQLHWPDRYVPIFGGTVYDVGKERSGSIPIEETALGIKKLLDSGKIKAYGLSNETTYGVCEWARVANKLSMPLPATIQNPLSLIARNFEGDLAEACTQSNLKIGLLPWSVLGGGILSGKYRDGQPAPPANSRHMKYPDFMSRWNPQKASSETVLAVDAYAKIAHDAGMSLSDLSIRWCRTRSYCQHGSVIIGATTLKQLEENLDSFSGLAELPEAVLAQVDEVHRKWRNPGTSL